MKKGRPIYPEEEARMVRLWQDGKTYEEVAIKTDRERSKWGAIAKKCEALGLSYGEASARGLL